MQKISKVMDFALSGFRNLLLGYARDISRISTAPILSQAKRHSIGNTELIDALNSYQSGLEDIACLPIKSQSADRFADLFENNGATNRWQERDLNGILFSCGMSMIGSHYIQDKRLSYQSVSLVARKSEQVYRKAWYSLLGISSNPFRIIHPLLVPGYDEELESIINLLKTRPGSISVEGADGYGKTAFLRKLSERLIFHQIDNINIVPCFIENRQSSGRQFTLDLFCGLFSKYSLERPTIRAALMNSFEVVNEEKLRIMESIESKIVETVFLSSREIEARFDKKTANDILTLIVNAIKQSNLKLVVLIDDLDGKVRSDLTTAQLNILDDLDKELNGIFIIGTIRPRKKIPRSFQDSHLGLVEVRGLPFDKVEEMIGAFFNDPRVNAAGMINGLDNFTCINPSRIIRKIHGLTRDAISVEASIPGDSKNAIIPRMVVSFWSRILEVLSGDFLNPRYCPTPSDLETITREILVNHA